MEKHKTCSFFGHRKIGYNEKVKEKVKKIVENLIVYCGVRVFLFGSRSEFDGLCHLVVTQLKEKYQEIKRIAYTCKGETCILESEKNAWGKIYSRLHKPDVVLLGVEEEFNHKTKYTAGRASYVERNQAMVNDSAYCVFYYDENYLPKGRNIPLKAVGNINQTAEQRLRMHMQRKRIKY